MILELDLMIQIGVFGEVMPVVSDGKAIEFNMHRLSISSDWGLMTRTSCTVSDGNQIYIVLLNNQASLHVIKNEALMTSRVRNLMCEVLMVAGLASPLFRYEDIRGTDAT